MSESDAATKKNLTQLLNKAADGDTVARDALVLAVQDELHRIAKAMMRNEKRGNTLQTTALLNEAFLRLFETPSGFTLRSRAVFFGAAARAMRQVLVDRAKARNALKRGGEFERVPLDEAIDALEEQNIDTIKLDEALGDLSSRSERQASVVHLRFFAGMTMAEIADFHEVSLTTIEADWRVARAFLRTRVQLDAA